MQVRIVAAARDGEISPLAEAVQSKGTKVSAKLDGTIYIDGQVWVPKYKSRERVQEVINQWLVGRPIDECVLEYYNLYGG